MDLAAAKAEMRTTLDDVWTWYQSALDASAAGIGSLAADSPAHGADLDLGRVVPTEYDKADAPVPHWVATLTDEQLDEIFALVSQLSHFLDRLRYEFGRPDRALRDTLQANILTLRDANGTADLAARHQALGQRGIPQSASDRLPAAADLKKIREPLLTVFASLNVTNLSLERVHQHLAALRRWDSAVVAYRDVVATVEQAEGAADDALIAKVTALYDAIAQAEAIPHPKPDSSGHETVVKALKDAGWIAAPLKNGLDNAAARWRAARAACDAAGAQQPPPPTMTADQARLWLDPLLALELAWRDWSNALAAATAPNPDDVLLHIQYLKAAPETDKVEALVQGAVELARQSGGLAAVPNTTGMHHAWPLIGRHARPTRR